MAKGAATSEGSSGEGISHFAAIRIRVTGRGQLRMAVYALDDLNSKLLVPFKMEQLARYAPTRLVNFTDQRASFQIWVSNIDERFRINRIIVFTKNIYKSFPGS